MSTINDWTRRVRELNGIGMTYAEIADHVGLSPGAVGDIASGRSGKEGPRGDAALKLDALHALKVGRRNLEGKAA